MKFCPIAALSLIACWFVALLALTNASAEPPIVDQIRIEGNQRVEKDAILIHVTQEPGLPLDEGAVGYDIREIHRMGFFDAVSAKLVYDKDRPILVYTVHERPQVIEVRIEGMTALSRADPRVVHAVKLYAGAILDPLEVRASIDNLTSLHKNIGYTNAKVTVAWLSRPSNAAIAVFKVTEKPQ